MSVRLAHTLGLLGRQHELGLDPSVRAVEALASDEVPLCTIGQDADRRDALIGAIQEHHLKEATALFDRVKKDVGQAVATAGGDGITVSEALNENLKTLMEQAVCNRLRG